MSYAYAPLAGYGAWWPRPCEQFEERPREERKAAYHGKMIAEGEGGKKELSSTVVSPRANSQTAKPTSCFLSLPNHGAFELFRWI